MTAKSSTVTVACKLPNGLVASHGGVTITFKGANDPGAVVGYGMTPDVDADWFAAWSDAMGGNDFAPIKSGAIVSHATDAKGVAKERKANTGLEPIDPDKPGPGIEKVADPVE